MSPVSSMDVPSDLPAMAPADDSDTLLPLVATAPDTVRPELVCSAMPPAVTVKSCRAWMKLPPLDKSRLAAWPVTVATPSAAPCVTAPKP